MELCWILSKAFSSSIEMIKWFLSLILLMCYITFNDLHMLNHSCIHGIKPTWSWCMIFPICYRIWPALLYWGFLYLCSLRGLAFSSLFWMCPCLVLGWV
jgi:hypothetical protein